MLRLFLLAFTTLLFVGCRKSVGETPQPPQPPSVPVPPPAIKFTGYTYRIGNAAKKLMDTFLLHFNQPVQVQYVKLKQDFCVPELQYARADSGRTVVFYRFLCGRAGGEYPFEYSVTDTLGRTLTDSVVIRCYSRKLPLAGTVRSYFVTADNRFCWATSNAPNQITCFGMTDTAVKKSFDLDFIPGKAVYNPYNDRLYILSSIEDFAHRSTIYVMNPANGEIEKTIPVRADVLNHPQYQELFPFDIAFAANGYGVLLVEDANYTPRWKVIDSRLNDSIYIHAAYPAGGTGNWDYATFKSAHANFDRTKLLMLRSYSSCRVGALDAATGELAQIEPEPAPYSYNNFIVPNKLNDAIYFCNVRNQFIWAPSGAVSRQSEFDNRWSPSADFSYRTGEQDVICYLNNHELQILDYAHGTTLMSCPFQYDLDKINCTTDGRYLVAMGNRALLLFDRGVFDQNAGKSRSPVLQQ